MQQTSNSRNNYDIKLAFLICPEFCHFIIVLVVTKTKTRVCVHVLLKEVISL